MYSRKRFCQTSLLISSKYFHQRIIMICLGLLYDILYTSTVLDAAILLSAQGTTYIPTNRIGNYSSTGDSYFQIRTQRCAHRFCSFLPIVYIWELGFEDLANSFWDHVIQISIKPMNFHNIFSQLRKVKIFCGNIYSL